MQYFELLHFFQICVPLTSVMEDSNEACNKENPHLDRDLPAYPEDLPAYPEDSPERITGRDNLVKPGYHHEQQQRWGFFKSVGKSVGNFFSDSLYW